MTDLQEGPQLLVVGVLLVVLLGWLPWRRSQLWSVLEHDEEAELRAAALLRELLSETEREQLARNGYVVVPSCRVEGRVYRVPARPGWVDVYESGKLAMRICVEPVERLPAADVVLMHKLMIEGNEEEYLREANIVCMRPRPDYTGCRGQR